MAATPLEVEAIKEYLISVGCKIEYPILVNAFKKHLYNPDPNVQGRVRTQFKDYVNRLATVSLENNMKFIILRPEFRPAEFQQMPNGHKQAAPQQQQQHQQQQQQLQHSPPSAITPPQAPRERHRAPPSSGMQPEASHEPRRPRMGANQPPQPVRQPQMPQMPVQSPRFPPQHHDQIDTSRLAQQQHPQQHFQFPTSQLPPPMQQQQSPQRQLPPPPPPQATAAPQQQLPPPPPPHQHGGGGSGSSSSNSINNSNIAMNQFSELSMMSASHLQSRPGRPMQYSAGDSANHQHLQQKSLPPTPQFHMRTQSQPAANQQAAHNQPSYQQQVVHSPLAVISNNVGSNKHLQDDSAFLMPPPPPPHGTTPNQHLTSSPLRAARDQLPAAGKRQDTPIIARMPSAAEQMPPPRPPPRRRQSTASLFKPSQTKPIEKISREFSQDLARKSLAGRVREHATRFNSSASTSDLSALMPRRNCSMKENRLSRESVFGGIGSHLQRNGSQLRSRSSHRGEDESDSSSLQPVDPLRRKWAIEACNCNYNNLVSLLREDPKLAACKDIVNGYTALHWAAKFGNLDIIKLIAGTYQVSANTKSSAGLTPLHVAYMFNRLEAANLLAQSYRASQDVRDHSGKKPQHYMQRTQPLAG